MLGWALTFFALVVWGVTFASTRALLQRRAIAAGMPLLGG